MTRLKIAFVILVAMAAVASAGVVATGSNVAVPTPPASVLSTAPIADEPKPKAGPTAQMVNLTVDARDIFEPTPSCRTSHSRLRNFASETRPTATTDASGTAQFSVPADIRYLRLTASRDGFVPQAIRWDHEGNSTAVPDHLVFQMEKATKISGRVVNQDQQPIAGADRCHRRQQELSPLPAAGRSPVSDDRDRREWEMVVHVSPRPARFSQGHGVPPSLPHGAYVLPPRGRSRSPPRDGSATLRLQRGATIDGSVVGPDGRPVADAEIVVGGVVSPTRFPP